MNRRKSLSFDCVNMADGNFLPRPHLQQRISNVQDSSNASSASSIYTVLGMGNGPADFQMMTGNAGNRYLSLMFEVLNQNLESIGRLPNEPLKMKDLDRMSPELLRRIMVFLVSTVISLPSLENPPQKIELKRLSELEVFNTKVYYDPSIDYVYWNLKRIFFDNEEMCDYYVLYFPQSDPKRAKRILSYITGFVLFCEQTMEKFLEMQEGLKLELAQKEVLTKLIEESKTKLNSRIVELEEWKSEIPSIQEKLQENNEIIDKDYQENELLESEIKTHIRAYEGEESKNLEIEKELEIIQARLDQKQKKIVGDGEELLKTHRAESERLNLTFKDRDELDKEFSKLTTTETVIETLIDEAVAYAGNLEEFVTFMESMVGMVEAKNKLSMEKHQLCNIDKESKQNLQKLTQDLERATAIISKEIHTKKEELRERRNQIQQLTEEAEKLELCKNAQEQKLGAQGRDLSKVKQQIQQLKTKIQEDLEYVQVKGPAKVDLILKELQECVDACNTVCGPDIVGTIRNQLLNISGGRR